MLKTLLNFLITLLSRPQSQPSESPKPSVPASPQNPPQIQPEKADTKVEVDWTNPASKVSKYFTVKEALFLPSWNCYHIPSEDEKKAIVTIAQIMDKVREFLNLPIGVHVWIRPGKLNCPTFDPKTIKLDPKDLKYEIKKAALEALDYNSFILGAKRSPHRLGQGVDWSAKGLTCDEIRKKLEPKLEEFGLRMEDLPGSNWVHNDTYSPSVSGGKRFFKP